VWTHYLRNVTFHDNFKVGGDERGSAITAGSGASAGLINQLAEAQRKIFVGPKSASTVIAGGYIQGGGHSAFSPTFGLASDNALGKSQKIRRKI
jgi:FAD/FMN-containing dehydrogenase